MLMIHFCSMVSEPSIACISLHSRRPVDPNKEGQNVFNIIPQQDLYDPWGRPGAGAPLIHQPTGQKFTRYSGSLQEKLVKTRPSSFRPLLLSPTEHQRTFGLRSSSIQREYRRAETRSGIGTTASTTGRHGTSLECKSSLSLVRFSRSSRPVTQPSGSRIWRVVGIR